MLKTIETLNPRFGRTKSGTARWAAHQAGRVHSGPNSYVIAGRCMEEKRAIGVEWVIAGGQPQITVQIVLNASGIVLGDVQDIGKIATLTLDPQAAHTLAAVLKDKAEAAARKAGIVLQNKLGHEQS